VVAAGATAFAPGGVPGAGALGLSVAVAGGVAMLYARVRAPELPARAALAFDLVVSALIVLLVVDVVGYTSDGPQLSSGSGLAPEVVRPAAQIHLDYFLRPVNDLLHGRPLLVESASQYGVLNFHLLAAWFQLAPIGYGPLGLFAGLLTAAQYVAGYWIVRLAGFSRVLAAAALGTAAVVTVLAGYGSPAFFPSTGGLRFGLPFAAVLAVLLTARRSGSAATFGPVSLVILGASALWSAETFIYVAAAVVSMAALDAVVSSGSVRQAGRRLGGDLARGALAIAAAHLLFGLVTLLLAGSWPDWGWYVEFFRAYSTGGLSQALAAPWSPVWLIGAAYFASFAGLAAIAASARAFALERRVTLLAMAGMSGAGAAFLSYFVGRSLDVLLVFVSLPAFLLGAIWLSLALNTGSVPRATKVAAVALASWLVVLGVALAWPQASDRWPRTALAHVAPGGRSLTADLARVWDSPPMDPRSQAGERLVREHFHEPGPALVIAEADLAQEILAGTGRGNALPLGMALEDELLFERAVRRVRQATDELSPGTMMLLQRDAFTDVPPQVGVISVIGGPRLSRVQLAAADAIASRFELEPVAKGAEGFEVVRLTEQRR
jgi:hypothetical protein